MRYHILPLFLLILFGCSRPEEVLPDPDGAAKLSNITLTPCADHRHTGFWELDFQIPYYFSFVLEVFSNVEADMHTFGNGQYYQQHINFRIPEMHGCEGIWKIMDVEYRLELDNADEGKLWLPGSHLPVIIRRIDGINRGDAPINTMPKL